MAVESNNNNYKDEENEIENLEIDSEEIDSEEIDDDEKEDFEYEASREKNYSPITSYMREMGAIQLFNRQEEIEVARRIEDSKNSVITEILKIPYTYKRILEQYELDKNDENKKVWILSKTIYLDTEESANNFEKIEQFLREEESIELPKISDCEEVESLIEKIQNYVSKFEGKNAKFKLDENLVNEIIDYNLHFVDFVNGHYEELKEINRLLMKEQSVLTSNIKYSNNKDKIENLNKLKKLFPRKIDTKEFFELFDDENHIAIKNSIRKIKEIENKLGVDVGTFKRTLMQINIELRV